MNDNSLTEGQRQYAKEFVDNYKILPKVSIDATTGLPISRKKAYSNYLAEKWKDENNRTVKGVLEQIKGLSYNSRVDNVRIRNKAGEVLYIGHPRLIPNEILQLRMNDAVPSRNPYDKNTYIIWTKDDSP